MNKSFVMCCGTYNRKIRFIMKQNLLIRETRGINKTSKTFLRLRLVKNFVRGQF